MSSPPYTPIVQELIDYLSVNPDFKAAFDESFQKAHEIKLEEWTKYNIQSVDDYLRYMNDFVHWVPREDASGKEVYNHICLFYFVINFLPIHGYRSPIHPSSRSPWTWLSEWILKYAQEMGKWMDEPDSITEETIKTFVDCSAYRDKEVSDFYYQYPRKPGEWVSFNEFFSREINPVLRPIADPDDFTVIACPADCAYGGQWNIREESTVEFHEPDVTIKAKGVPWSIRQLLDDGSSHKFGPLFSGGVFTHAFLSPANYHRVHAPVYGQVVHAKVVPGLCYLEVGVEPKPEATTNGPPKQRLTMRRRMMPEMTILPSLDGEKKPELDAPNTPGYQFLQARGVIIIQSEIGFVAVLPIGMAQVSSVLLSVKEGDIVKKGQELARFHLGGSDVVMVFDKDAEVNLDDWKNRPENRPGCSADPDCESFTKFGSRIGTGQRMVFK